MPLESAFWPDMLIFARENPNLYRLASGMPEVGGGSVEQTRLRCKGRLRSMQP